MKYLITILIILFSINLSAQAPQTINYQGYLTDASDNPINGNVDMNFTIWDDETSGNQEWSGETINGISVSNGVFNVVLGETTPITADFSDQYWLQITVDPTGDNVTLPRIQMSSAGYSLSTKRIEVSDDAGQNVINSINSATSGTIDAGRLGTGTADNTTFLRGDGSWQTPSGSSTTVLTNTKSISFSGGSYEFHTITVNGASTGDPVFANFESDPTSSQIVIAGARVTSSNTVTVYFYYPFAGAATIRATVIQ